MINQLVEHAQFVFVCVDDGVGSFPFASVLIYNYFKYDRVAS